MKIFTKHYYLFFFFALLVKNVFSYEVETHEKLSNKAVSSSLLNSNKKIINDIGMIGVEGYNTNKEILLKYILPQVEIGANFEDNGLRPLNHFYDPYNNIGLKSWIGYKSPNWALEDDKLDELPEQEYSLLDANSYLYQALSLEESKERETNFGKLFRTIGHVIHHVQDMAQPQHVRDDDHCGEVACSKAQFLDIFHPSLYEELSNANRNKLTFTGYINVNFNKARDFWHNSNWSGMADFTNQNFISIGTNFIVKRGGTFSTIPDYPEPQPFPEINNWSVKDIETELPPEYNLTGVMAFMSNSVFDRNLTGSSATAINNYGSTLSIFDQDLELEDACVQYTRKFQNDETKTYTYETCRLFTYNRANVEAAQKFLIPRAVAYSSGLINYFFRGRLDVTNSEQTTNTNGQNVLSVTVKNISAQNFALKNGKLEIFYDALVDGIPERIKAAFTDGTTGDLSALTNGAEVTLNVLMPTDVDNSKDNPFVVVYSGVIGEEQGVAGKVFKLAPETALLAWKLTSQDNYSYFTMDLHRSVDLGTSWTNVTNHNFKLIDNSEGYFYDSRILTTGSGQATALLKNHTGDGLYYRALTTSDNGNTWTTPFESSIARATFDILNNTLNKAFVPDGYYGLDMRDYVGNETRYLAFDYDAFNHYLMVSDDAGASWRKTFRMGELTGYEWSGPYHMSYLGRGKIVVYLYDGQHDWQTTFDGLLVSEDYGETWYLNNSRIRNNPPDYLDEDIYKLGVVTDEPGLVDVVRSVSY